MSTVLKTMANALITAMHQVSSVNVQPVGFLVKMVSLVILISQKSKLHAVILALIRGGPNLGPVKYVKEVSHVKHMHAN